MQRGKVAPISLADGSVGLGLWEVGVSWLDPRERMAVVAAGTKAQTPGVEQQYQHIVPQEV